MQYNVMVKLPGPERWRKSPVMADSQEHARRIVREYTDWIYGPPERVTLATAERR